MRTTFTTLTYLIPDTAAVPDKGSRTAVARQSLDSERYPAQTRHHDRKIYVSCTAPEGAAVKVNIVS